MDNEKREWIYRENGDIEWKGRPGDDGLDFLREQIRRTVEDNHISIAVKKMNLEALRTDMCPGYGQSFIPSSLLWVLHQSTDYQNKMSLINQAIASLETVTVLDGCSTYPQVVLYKERECPNMKNPQFCKQYCFSDGRKIDPTTLRKAIYRNKKKQGNKYPKSSRKDQTSLKSRESAQRDVRGNGYSLGQKEGAVHSGRLLLKNRD